MATQEEIYSQLDISIEEKDKLVADVIHYVLFKNHQSSGCPIKREELTSIITKTYRQRALPALVINEAREKLSSIFGYELKELQRARPLSANQNRSTQQMAQLQWLSLFQNSYYDFTNLYNATDPGQADVKSYVLISKLPPEVFQKYVEDKGNMHVTGFTFIAISIVHLAGGQISESSNIRMTSLKMLSMDMLVIQTVSRSFNENEHVPSHLKRLGLFETDQMHPVLGDVKQALESLVQRRFEHIQVLYLQKNKVNGPEGNILVYELAERALDKANFILVNARMKEYISQNANKEVQTGEDDEEQEEDD
ncbi:hypothetical protein C5167_017547 [Papaver somniferum]|uniref:MAGE domain-containing protein n=1 Tax=Papaver somniferum TaxID=3469 RepID=A0A4Y7IJQ5_PAPSO|nr:hypothetical protein C5167_017547 [Papaver somniferum]